jgi:hypothetical protein
MIIVLDTTEIVDDPYGRRPEWTTLLSNAIAWNARIVIPEVVVVEAVTVVRRHIDEQVTSLGRVKAHQFGIEADHKAHTATFVRLREEFQNNLVERIKTSGIEIAPPPRISHIEVVKRASAVRKPYDRGEK